MIKKIWQSRYTTVFLLLVFATFLVTAILVNFGPPSPKKIIFRLILMGILVAHLITVYPTQISKLLFAPAVKPTPQNKKKIKKESPTYYIWITLALVITAVLNLLNITTFVTADEPKWVLTRIPTFVYELVNLNWHKLFISDKPGISLSWIVASGFIFSKNFKSVLTNPYFSYCSTSYCTDHLAGKIMGDPQLLFWSRLPLIVTNVLLLLWLTLLVKKCVNSPAASLVFLILTATNPTIRGMTAIINPDSLSWFFPLGFFLTFFLYLKEKRSLFLWQSSLIFALGALNKFNFLIVYPLTVLLVPLGFLFFGHSFRFTVASFFRVFLLSWLISLIFWPYLLLAPQKYLAITIFKPLFRQIFLPITFLFVVYFWLGIYLEKTLIKQRALLIRSLIILPLLLGSLILATLYYTPHLPSVAKGTKVIAPFTSLVVNNFFYHIYSQTTLTFIVYLFCLASVFYISLKPNKQLTTSQFLACTSLLFILIFLLGSAASSHQTSPRYQIAVFPFVSLLIVSSSTWLDKLEFKKLTNLIIFAFFSINVWLLKPFLPYYLLYHNHLLPPGKLVFDGWGLGGYEAAQYLNKKPNAKNLKVYASYEGFKPFFKGQTLNSNTIPSFYSIDYFVIFKQGEKSIIIGNNPLENKFWREKAPAEFQFSINKVPVVKVIKNKSQ